MCSFKWCVFIVALFATDVRTEALKQKGLSPRRCHHCVHNMTNNCDQTTSLPVLCPVGQPVCATVTSAPNFTSTLTCSVVNESPCILRVNLKSELELTCTCINSLCNLPYSAQLRNELLKFITNIASNTSFELTEKFIKSSVFANVTKSKLYERMTDANEATVKPSDFVQSTTIGLITIDVEDIKPRAEALKQATVPPDDEDDAEGSGIFEESKSHVSAPAAPSSFLPAGENNVSTITLNIYLLLTLHYINILV